jgi:hypothetical protein
VRKCNKEICYRFVSKDQAEKTYRIWLSLGVKYKPISRICNIQYSVEDFTPYVTVLYLRNRRDPITLMVDTKRIDWLTILIAIVPAILGSGLIATLLGTYIADLNKFCLSNNAVKAVSHSLQPVDQLEIPT